MLNTRMLLCTYEVTYGPSLLREEVESALDAFSERVEQEFEKSVVLPRCANIDLLDRRTGKLLEPDEIRKRLKNDSDDIVDDCLDCSEDFGSVCERKGISVVEYTTLEFARPYESKPDSLLKATAETEASLKKISSDKLFEDIYLTLVTVDTLTMDEFEQLRRSFEDCNSDEWDESSDDGFM